MITRLLWLIARPGAAGRAPLVLPIVAFGIVTALTLTILGGAQRFFEWTDDLALMYQLMALIALTLLLVPLLTLCGEAARLSARRRDDRIATLLLLGAEPKSVAGMSVVESAALALLGALSGTVFYVVSSPLLGLISFRGKPLGVDGVLLDWWIVATVVVSVVFLAATSSIVGLRRVVLSPLGVRMRVDAPRLSWLRPVIGLAVVGGAVGLMLLAQTGVEVIVVMGMLVVAFGGTFLVLGLIGPWAIRKAAERQLRRARTPEKLLAARTILESPKVAWRNVSGVSMTSFIAVFGGLAASFMAAFGSAEQPELAQLAADIFTGLLITLIGSFLMVSASVAISQAADILDRAEITLSLNWVGVPFTTVDSARRYAIMSPLMWVALGSAAAALVVIMPISSAAALIGVLSLAITAVVIAVGILLVRLGVLATRPMLEKAYLGQVREVAVR